MTGKEKIDQILWILFAGIYVGKLKGHIAKEVFLDKDKFLA